jgi:hypothetical protein
MNKGFFVALGVVFMMLLPRSATLAQEQQPIFYPLPPDAPRLQFLNKYTSSLDIATENKGFRSFVFGGEENEDQVVQKPYGLAMHDGAIYVVDTRGNGYGVFDLKNNNSRMVQPSGAGALKKPINITIDVDGTRYVTDTARGEVLVFNSNDKFVRAIGRAGQFTPIDVAISGDRLYVSDVERRREPRCPRARQGDGRRGIPFRRTGWRTGAVCSPDQPCDRPARHDLHNRYQ